MDKHGSPFEPVRLSLDELKGSGRAVMTVEQAGLLLGLKRSATYDAVRRGQLPSLRLGRRLLVPVPALLALLGVEAGPQ
jgi:excisionase family DNA binding protein